MGRILGNVRFRSVFKISLWCTLLYVASGCAVVRRAGIAVMYKRAELPVQQVLLNLPYVNGASGNSSKQQQLNLFLPSGTNWPVLVFVHGGGWDAGDKDLRAGGADVYNNIGRFFALHGVGVAVINYRLQPQVNWRDQVHDVAAATVWTRAHIASYGGDPGRIFLMGHSAGAQLAAHVALNPAPLSTLGISSNIICGVVSVSGAGMDLSDAKTYELGQKLPFYEKKFGTGEGAEWKRDASPVTYATSDDPPFLILYARGESKSLKRQSQLLHDVLTSHRISSRIVEVPGQSHSIIVLSLSRDDKTAGPAILKFIEENRCRKN